MKNERPSLPRAVWALGFVSLCMDLSSEMIHGLLPAFLAVELGMGTVALGLVEGGAEAIASFMKVASGTWSDRVGNRKRLALLGYGLAAASKPLFALASGFGLVVAARCIDRLGKGIRGAPRDALVADVTPEAQRGAAYGLRQALDSVGAVLGPALAIALMIAFGDAFSVVFWVAVGPAVLAVIVLAVAVREPHRDRSAVGRRVGRFARWRGLGTATWFVIALASLLALARFTEAFLVLAVLDRGLPVAWSPLALVVMNLVYAALSFPAGRLADRVDRSRLLAFGALVLALGHGTIAMSSAFDFDVALVFLGIALYGAHMALTQGLMSAWLAAVAPAAARGTAFGLMHFATDVTTLAAGLLAGSVWATTDARTTFVVGAAIALAVVSVALLSRRRER